MKINFPKKTNEKNFFIKEGLDFLVPLSEKKMMLKDIRVSRKPFLPILKDLYYLYQLTFIVATT